MRVLLDTNIIIDVALERQPFYTSSVQVLTFAYRDTVDAFISASTASDIYYLIRKAKGHEATLEFLRIIASFCRIATVDQTVISNALTSSFKDFEDAVQYETAIANQLEAIATGNCRPEARASPQSREIASICFSPADNRCLGMGCPSLA